MAVQQLENSGHSSMWAQGQVQAPLGATTGLGSGPALEGGLIPVFTRWEESMSAFWPRLGLKALHQTPGSGPSTMLARKGPQLTALRHAGFVPQIILKSLTF